MNPNRIALFTDISLNSKEKIGFGSYLIIPESDLKNVTLELIKINVQLKKFKSTSSTKLEIETLLWAIEELINNHKQVYLFGNLSIYTDSQSIVSLPERRKKLESSGFKSVRKNKKLNNAIFYRKYYQYQDKLRFKLLKIKGHSKLHTKDILHKLFTLVDRISRKALRTYLEKNKIH
ncbi:hypothetical protein ES703_58457 [subsurface metagenome]